MDKYNTYSCHNLLAYIDLGCKRMGEERDYPGHLLSMEQADSIDKLVQIYNNIYKLLAVLILDSYELPKNWYKKNCLGIGNDYLFEELNQYFNTNILRLYKTYQYPTEVDLIKCLANLREAINVKEIQEEIILMRKYGDVDELFFVTANRKKHYEQRTLIETKGDYSSKYNDSFTTYKHYSRFLAAHFRIFDIAEIAFGEDHNFSYDGLAEEYKLYKEKAKERAAQKEIEERRLVEKRWEKERQLAECSNALDGVSSFFGSVILNLGLGFLGAILPFGRRR